MLRWMTAGECHGPALVGVVEGLPAGVSVTTGDVRDALARRRLGYGRGARMKFEHDAVRFLGGVRHGVHHGRPGRGRGRQHRVAQVGDRDEPRPGRRRRAGRAGPQRPAHPAPPRPRRPGRDAEVRLRRRPPRARARERPGDRSPRRARRRRRRAARAGRRRPAGQPHRRHRAGRRPGGRAAARPGRRRGAGRRPGALPRPRHERGDGRRDRRLPPRRRHPRRRRRGASPTACRRAWAATSTATAGSTAGWPGPSWASRP